MKRFQEVFAAFTAHPDLLLPPLIALLVGRVGQLLPVQFALWTDLALTLCDLVLIAGLLPRLSAALQSHTLPPYTAGFKRLLPQMAIFLVPLWWGLTGANALLSIADAQARVIAQVVLIALLVLAAFLSFLWPIALSITGSFRDALRLAVRVLRENAVWMFALAMLELLAHSLLPSLSDSIYASINHLTPDDMPKFHYLAALSLPLCALVDALAWGMATQLALDTSLQKA